MKVDVVLSPAEIALLRGRDLSGVTCVVFDVLRATSSMVTAFAHGVGSVVPVETIEEAWDWRRRDPGVVLGGERHGDRIEGFDLGNSPFEYRSGLEGRCVVTTTTNGTVALRACASADRVLVGALLNLETVFKALCSLQPDRVLLVCAGTFAEFALEDAVAAGRLVARLESVGGELGDAAHAVAALGSRYARVLEGLLASANGRVLVGRGRREEVEWCARESVYGVVPVLEGESLTVKNFTGGAG
jgi:2-phosphosulfolactate phosphatase